MQGIKVDRRGREGEWEMGRKGKGVQERLSS
jgi:hypothetical protein